MKLATYDSSNPEDVAKLTKDEADRAKDLGFIMSQPRGRRWIYELIHTKCHVYRSSHVISESDSTAFNEGSRSIGLSVLDELRTNYLGAYLEMLEENSNG